jgi:hypothetical protein
MNVNGLLRKLPIALVTVFSSLILSCSNNPSLPQFWFLLAKPYFTGTITGTVLYVYNNAPLEGVTIKIDVRGTTCSATTGPDGTFSLEAEQVKKDEGYNVNFTKVPYDDATRAAVFRGKSKTVDLGTVYMNDATAGMTERTVSGQVLDNYGSNGLAGATVSVQNSHYETIVGVTDSSGNFQLTGTYIMVNSSYTVTIEKQDYITTSSVTVSVTGSANTIDGSPVRLYRRHGDITGAVEDDNTGSPLAGASVNAVDGRGNTVSAITDGSGNFRLTGIDFYVGFSYDIAISKTDYFNGSATAAITASGDNSITGGAVHLMINGSVSGTVRDPDGDPVAGASVQAKDAADAVMATGTSAADGTYSLSTASFRKNVSYAIHFTHAVYESTSTTTPGLIEGNNAIGAVTMTPKTFTGYTLTGVIADDWDTVKKLPAAVSIIDEDGITRTATAGSDGAFSVTGKFIGAAAYTLKASCAGYTGDTMIDRRELSVSVTGSSPQSLGQITLFPIGIRANISGQKREFSSHIKQTHEKFLTGKTGFTLSARTGTVLNSASTFYLHTDDQEQPAAPDGAHSSSAAVNGAHSSGYLSAGIESDIRTVVIGMKSSATYHFRVTDPGEFVIETSGSTNTYLLLYDEGGTLIDEADDGGSGNNAKLTVTLPEGVFFAVVRGYDDNIYGFYEIGVTGPVQTSGMTGEWTTGDLILSWYDCADSTVYIAGAGETGSSGGISVSMMRQVGGISRGSFSGTLRAITQTGATVPVTGGYFNVIRSE